MYPNEYGPLHTFVAVWSILLSLLGFREIIEWKRLARIFSAWKIGMMTAGAVLLSLAVLVFLASDSMYSWIIWDATGLSRHVTVRMELPGGDKIQNPNRTDEGMNLVLKPNLTSHEILAKQKQRSIATAPHIVLLIVDNVQTDHVGAYGYRQNPTTPNIDALAKTGTLFENAYSSYPQTRYFSCALLMGRYFASFSRHLFPPSYARLSIIRLLKKRRYLSLVRAWFESAMEKDFNPGDYNIDQYFRPLYENHPLADEGLVDWFKLSENERLNTVRAHLSAADKKGVPALIWIHAIRPHWKGKKIQYAASDKFPFGNETTDRYDSAIAAADHWFGRMKEMVEKQRGKREVVWIVGSDHGAGLGRYKGGSGKSLFDVHTRIPLIIAAPGFSPNRVSTPIDTPLDLAATMLDVAGVQIPEVYQGISLLPLMNGTEEADRIIPLGYGTQWIGAVYRNWKLIRRNDATSLFDLSTDKRELINIADKHPRLTRRLLRFAESTSEKRFYGTKAR
ncbi:MAG: sulfatase-like hydrolase/transferase [Proteobacteria bacterium]|nr:sulfatase-like hydrolase/transferase [Pseudomonadota bacterium]